MLNKKKLTVFSALTMSALVVGLGTNQGVLANNHSDAEGVLDQSNQAMESLSSFSSTMDIHQTITDDLSGEMELHSMVEQDVILDPFKLRQTMTTSMEGMENISLTAYWTEEGYFQEDPEGGWMKISEGTADFDGMTYHPGDQIDEMALMGEDVTLSEEGNYYVITYVGDGEALTDLINETMNGSMEDDDMAMMDELMGDIEVNDFSYELYIDMDTYYVSEMMLEMDMDVHMDGETANIYQMIDMSFHNYNNVEDFDVPNEAKEEAEDIEDIIEDEMEEAEEHEEGGELPATATNTPMMTLGGLVLALVAGAFLIVRRRLQQV
ncbi:LPXTG cell wall anchor domain-containing protein [Alteribacter aurantiacus]|uniref:LPXTG cell wall anchor domain-containing protein n=1 Tax=Alteribacter aurantiacus TaxID=254410 RepID=UPI00040B549B|nr:LPXTG cell wall anchor domain-containing protein [Alteribacter aurantiacus]